MRVCSTCHRLVPHDARLCPQDGAAVETVQLLPPGTKVGAYVIVKPLGEGGMGHVFEATHEVLGRRSAIKFLHAELATDPQLVARFLQEAKAVNLINHDHIVNVYDFSDGSDGAVYFVMEYLEGETLQDYMARRQQLEPEDFFELFDQILEALAAAHAKKVVHRDLKPANVFLVERHTGSPFVKLLDFGVAKLTAEGSAQGMTAAGALIGTPHYMSPEQFEGKPADVRADVFAAGIMMFEAITGKRPFDGRDLSELAVAILRQPAPLIPQLRPGLALGSELDAIVGRCLAKKPADRYASAAEVRAALAAIRPRGEADAPAPARPVSSPSPARRRRPLVWAIAAVAVVAAAGGVLAATLGGSSEPGESEVATADAGPSTPRAMWRAGDRRGAVDAARGALAAALASSERRERAAALDAIALVAHPALAPLLYDGLAGGPDTRVESARILAELALPEAAARIREALSGASDRTRVDLALALLACGDRDGVAILEGALRDSPGDRLRAAIALAELDGRAEAVAVIEEVFANSPEGRSRWREAARVLLGLGNDRARKALVGELSHRDRERSVPAAAILAAADVEEGRGFLERLLAGEDREARSLAALALARVGAGAAASSIDEGLASGSAAARARALAVAARLQTVEKADVIADAADEENITVRLTASAALVALAPRMGIR